MLTTRLRTLPRHRGGGRAGNVRAVDASARRARIGVFVVGKEEVLERVQQRLDRRHVRHLRNRGVLASALYGQLRLVRGLPPLGPSFATAAANRQPAHRTRTGSTAASSAATPPDRTPAAARRRAPRRSGGRSPSSACTHCAPCVACRRRGCSSPHSRSWSVRNARRCLPPDRLARRRSARVHQGSIKQSRLCRTGPTLRSGSGPMSNSQMPNCSSLSKRNSRNAIVTAIETASYSLTLTATHPVSFVHSRPLVLPTDHSRPDPGWSGPNENRRRFSGNSATLGRRASCLLPWPTDRICRDTPTRRFPDPGDLGSCASCSGSQGWPWPRHWACHSSS